MADGVAGGAAGWPDPADEHERALIVATSVALKQS
jgi:hypothetical protein